MIDFYKYLNCSRCKNTPPYCFEHRKEVELKLAKEDCNNSNSEISS